MCMLSDMGTCGTALLYLLVMLLPQALWLLHGNNGWSFAVCESCGKEGDTRTFVRTFLNSRNASSKMELLSEPQMESEKTEDSQSWEYESLCSCELAESDHHDDMDIAGEGGWTTPIDFPDLSGPCTIVRVEASTLTQREFETRFAYTEPVIITGLPEQVAFKASSTKYRLLKDYGHDIITVATANTHSYRKEKVTLCDYVERMMGAQTIDHLGNETLYHFGDNNREEWSSLFSLYYLPPYQVPHTTPVLSFGLAGPGTGVPFHIHGPTFAETLYGRKRWFLYPPGPSPQFNPDQCTLQWLTHTYPTFEDHPLECTLEPGEVIYFPDKWWHATLNVDTAVFMSTFYS